VVVAAAKSTSTYFFCTSTLPGLGLAPGTLSTVGPGRAFSGQLGGLIALNHFADVLHALGAEVLSCKVRLPAVQHYLDEATLTDEKYLQRLRAQIKRLDQF
jgi:NAD(P)H-dependent FMN reductase